MVAVGDHHGRGLDGAHDVLHHVGRVEDPQRVDHAVVVGRLGPGRPVGPVGVGQAPGERQPPDGREVGPRGPQQVETIAAVLGDGLLVRQDVAPWPLAHEGADHARGGADAGHMHPVGVEGRRRVRSDQSLSRATREQLGGGPVAVEPAAVVLDGKLDVDGVGAVARRQLGALVGTDDVVGGSDHLVEADGAVVTQADEGPESGHGSLRSTPRRALTPCAGQGPGPVHGRSSR